MLRTINIQDLEATGAAVEAGLALAARSCSLLKIDPQVLQRHPVMGVRAALATLIRDGLNDNPSSPPQSRHRRLATGPRFQVWRSKSPRPGHNGRGQGARISLQELNAFGL